MKRKKLWLVIILVVVISFGVLIFLGTEIYRKARPVPEKLLPKRVSFSGTGMDIKDGQNVWQLY